MGIDLPIIVLYNIYSRRRPLCGHYRTGGNNMAKVNVKALRRELKEAGYDTQYMRKAGRVMVEMGWQDKVSVESTRTARYIIERYAESFDIVVYNNGYMYFGVWTD